MDRARGLDRARRRAGWPVRRHRLGAEPGADLSASTAAEARIATMWPLALAAWRLGGWALPDYPRAGAPVRIIRPPLPRRGEPVA